MSKEFDAPVKDPQAVLRHSMNWSDWLREGETLLPNANVFSDKPDDLIIELESTDIGSGKVSWTVRGGTVGRVYKVTCQVETNLGAVDQRSVLYRVLNR